MTTKRMTGQEWCARNGVTFDWSANGYQRDSDGWEYHAFTVTLRAGDRDLQTSWRQGLGIEHDPTADTVLPSLAMDAQYGALDWDDYAREWGHDADHAPLSAYRTWEACRNLQHLVLELCHPDQAMFEEFMEIREVGEEGLEAAHM